MQLGALNKVIELFKYSSATTLSSGQKQDVFATEGTFFANVLYKDGSEGFEAGQKVASNTVVFTIHNILSDYNTRRKVLYDSEYYAVHRIVPIENDVFLELTCKVRDNLNAER